VISKLSYSNIWVDDQEEALTFWVDKVGLELREDVTMPEMGNFRWLTVGVPGQDCGLVLMSVPGAPVFEAETVAQLKAVISKGAAGGVFFETDDCRATYEQMRSRGVEFTQEPFEQPYGIDAGFRDPSGNHHRLTERRYP
jgi:predicted enzyme related to lactoylglutathione lyase